MKLVRLSVNLNEDTAAALKEAAENDGITATEVVRRAISLYKLARDEAAAGNRLQIKRRDGKVSDLVIL
jgi:hypothetical protein